MARRRAMRLAREEQCEERGPEHELEHEPEHEPEHEHSPELEHTNNPANHQAHNSHLRPLIDLDLFAKLDIKLVVHMKEDMKPALEMVTHLDSKLEIDWPLVKLSKSRLPDKMKWPHFVPIVVL